MTLLRQRGLGLVELMVGITVGLIVATGASIVAVNQINEHRRLMLETQIQQDLRAAADLIEQDLRRAGARSLPALGVWAPPAAVGTMGEQLAVAATPNQFTQMVETRNEKEISLTYLYSTSIGNVTDAPVGAEHFGIKWDRKSETLYVQIGEDNWQPITDPDTVRIKDFDFSIDSKAVDLPDFCDKACNPPTAGAPACPKHEVRRIGFTMVGQAARDAGVRRTLSNLGRMRADIITGGCPA